MKPQLLVAGQRNWGDREYRLLESLGFDLLVMPDEWAPIPATNRPIVAAVCNSLFLYHSLDLLPGLQLLQLTSAGMDRIPLAELQSRGVVTFTAEDTYSVPVAEWVVSKILEHYKRSAWFFEKQQSRAWAKRRDQLELMGAVATIVGMGSIGANVAKRLRAFEVRVLGVDRRERSDHVDAAFDRSELDEVMPMTDILILAVPSRPTTRHLLNERRLAALRPGALVVNASRGAVLDEVSLAAEIARGHLSGACLDVFESEPLPYASPLWGLDGVSITPHIAHVSPRTQERLLAVALRNLASMGVPDGSV